MTNKIKKYYIKIDTLSPIHIGTGDYIDPYDYVIQNNKLYIINKELFLHTINIENNQTDFITVVSENKMNEIRKFIHNNFKIEMAEYSLDVSDELQQKYDKNIDDANPKNALEIKNIIRSNYYNTPIIPGSSLKGSITTAILNNFNNGKKVYKNIKNEILDIKEKDKSDDPFRTIKVSDFLILNNNNVIASNICNWDYNSKKNRMLIPMETIKRNSTFIGCIDIIENTISKKTITIDKIKESLNKFYQSCYSFEKDKFKINLKLTPDDIIMKVGKHSGAFAMTLDGNRKISSKKVKRDINNKPILNNFGKKEYIYLKKESQDTTWLCEGQPIGWVKFNIIEKEAYLKLNDEIIKRNSEIIESYKQKKIIIQKFENKLIEKAKKDKLIKEKIEKEKKELENKEKLEQERYNSLSDFEKLLYDIERADESKLGNSFNNIDNFTGDEKIKIAASFKNAFIKLNKFDGNVSKKQKEKNIKIKEILGD